MSKPLISVFTPYYNDEKFLRTSIESVLNNNYQNFELILLNHATKDSCREIAHSYNDNRIKHIDMFENLGGGSGLLFQKMLDISSGKYVKVVCADDVLRNDGLEILVDYMEKHPEKDFAFGNVEYINEMGEDLKDNMFENRKGFSINNSEVDCLKLLAKAYGFLPWGGAIIKHSILDKIPINKTFQYCFDTNLWLTILSCGYKIGYVNKLVLNYRIHDRQASSLSAAERVDIYAWFEHKTYYKSLFLIKDIKMVKDIWPNSRFKEQLTEIRDIPFYIAHNLFIEDAFAGNSATYIDELLNNEEERIHLENIFGYGIKEFRDDIFLLSKKNNSQKKLKGFKKFKQKIYSKQSKNLGLRDMAFLFIHRLYDILTFKPIRKKISDKKHKRYSL